MQTSFINPLILSLLGAFTTTMNAQTNLLTVQSTEKQTALLELYTSEGCSSCPPAEAWLSHLKESPGLWEDFVPVAFHVDYWDYLGWRDSWGAKQFSDRQRVYAERWRSDSVYTPEFVLNGSEWRDWTGHKSVPAGGAAVVGVLTATSSDTNHWQVSFAPASLSKTQYEVHAALLGSGLKSSVKAGENRGRQLSHDFVALKLVDAPLVRHENLVTGKFVLDARQSSSLGRLAVVVWVNKAGSLEPLQAAGGWLASP